MFVGLESCTETGNVLHLLLQGFVWYSKAHGGLSYAAL